jgi:hypothetical protein
MRMRDRSATRTALSVLLAVGFVYAGAATARRYRGISQSPAQRHASASIDAQLAPARIASAAALREAAVHAGWRPGEDVVVLARASAMDGGQLTQVFYATGYVLYPSQVWLAAWCDERATPAQCETVKAQSPESAAAPYRARRFLVIGGENPFSASHSARLSDVAALVSLQ